MTVICVDLSNYQKGFDFNAFKKGGGLGVICKATEGSSIQDKSYKTFRNNAEAAGLAFASYHFLRPGDMTAQANYFLNFAAPGQGERVVADYEDPNVDVADLKAFLQAIQKQRSDLQLTVYSGNTIEEALAGAPDTWLADNSSLWTAQYAGTPSPWESGTWTNWTLWQYTDCGSVPGFGGAVDCNRFNGPDSQFLKWMGPVSETPTPSPETATVTITTTGDVKIIINGQEYNVTS
jgi:GH25 family lysozyme M1 (1,4-beta-N-acetylmuramidase)